MKTDNELIAEFMGEVITGVTANYKQPVEVFVLPKKPMGRKPGRAIKVGYDTSWDWLMPVVEKINKLFDEAFPPGEEFVKRILAHEEPFEREYMDVVGLPISSTIDDVYQAVVTFIKWYNEQK